VTKLSGRVRRGAGSVVARLVKNLHEWLFGDDLTPDVMVGDSLFRGAKSIRNSAVFRAGKGFVRILHQNRAKISQGITAGNGELVQGALFHE
jgi:hypothetical protein